MTGTYIATTTAYLVTVLGCLNLGLIAWLGPTV
jgi:hypothetical protein